MRKRTVSNDIQPRMTDISGALLYAGVGRNTLLRLAHEYGACKKCGRRLLIDLRLLDAALDALPEAGQEKAEEV